MGLIFKEESYSIRGALYEVYREKGAGFTEPIYHECLVQEFSLRKLPAVSEPQLELYYKGTRLEKTLRPDFVCFGKIIVEIKAVRVLTDEHRAQLLNYLKATGFQLGFLVNFGHFPEIEIERMVHTTSDRITSKTPPKLQ